MLINIEVAVSEETSTTEQGRLLETLGREILETSHFEVVETVRLTGIEVDLLAKHKSTSETVFVECKAQQANLSADIITKLLGNIMLKGVSCGWLLSTAQFGKDAKGIADEWEKKPPEEKRKLQLYPPKKLVELLISTKSITPPASLHKPEGHQYAEEAYLLITNHGRFWAMPTVDATAGVQKEIFLFDAKTGKLISDSKIISSVSKTKTSLKDLNWLQPETLNIQTNPSILLTEELQSIVKVPSGDNWADYRPARPKDFVGREKVQKEVFEFLDDVREGEINTRLLAIKSPSGWGKSSILLKLTAHTAKKRNLKKYFFYPVDCRAAVSKRYAELALKRCLDEAVKTGFLPTPKGSLALGGSYTPLSDSSLQPLLQHLRETKKVVVLFFDQFEEIFAKQELQSLFTEIGNLCSAVDSAQENIILGFSWKTDGTIPQDHAAYHMWQNLTDRRREFSLTPFDSTDVSKALTIFSKELGQQLNPQLRKLLIDHCQGFPWLLKKLCIHVYDMIKGGTDQTEVLNQALNISDLFKRELSELSATELECVKQIATESPAEFFIIENRYGGATVTALLTKRLVLRSGSRLILYWDIFRDYVLSGKVPSIPVSYIPQTEVFRYATVINELLKNKTTTVSDIVKSLGVSANTADNILRDLVMIGNAEANRKSGSISVLQNSEIEAARVMNNFWNSHVLLRKLIEEKGGGFSVTEDEIKSTLQGLARDNSFADKTWGAYAHRIVGWWLSLGIVTETNGRIIHIVDNAVCFPNLDPKARRGRGKNLFLGEAPPDKVIETIDSLINGNALGKGARNSLYVLKSLGLVDGTSSTAQLTEIPVGDVKEWLANKVVQSGTMKAVAIKSKSSAKEIGGNIAATFALNWSEASKLRYGSAIHVWKKWITALSKTK